MTVEDITGVTGFIYRRGAGSVESNHILPVSRRIR